MTHVHQCEDCRGTFTCLHVGQFWQILPCDGIGVFFCIGCSEVRGLDFCGSAGAKGATDTLSLGEHLEGDPTELDCEVSFD